MNPDPHKETNTDEHIQNEAIGFLKNTLYIIVGLLIGYFFLKQNTITSSNTSKFDELLTIINQNYVDTIAIKQIENKAVSNLLSNLDPHSVYISKEELQAANEPLEGNFSGVGIEFFISNDTLLVVSPIVGGPSEMVGIKSGDKIITINDTTVAGVKLKNSDVVKKLRGPIDSKVKIGIQRNHNPKIINFVVIRNNIKVNSVESGILMDHKVGYIKINSFGENTYSEFVQELRTLVKKDSITSLILDLRQNTGGYLEIAVAILDELIPEKQLLVYTQGRNYPKEQYFSEKKGLFETGKLAVLIDEGSASASEIVAGAIQDLDRGIIVGRRSFGKGLVQNQLNLKDGSAVRLTVARYYTPSGRNIQKPYSASIHYEDDIINRYNGGEFFDESKQKYTDTTKFYTKNGRLVKRSGGITPDVFIPLDTNYDLVNFSKLRAIVPDFVYSNHETLAPKINNYHSLEEFHRKFVVSDDLLHQFFDYAKSQKVDWNKARWNSFHSKLTLSIKAYIAKQFFHNKGLYIILNDSDPVIAKTKIKLLNK